MIRLAGGAILVLSAVIWGRRQGESVKKRCAITAALCDFVRYTGERIETFRDPLCDIFSSYRDDVLGECGFIAALKESGAAAAVAAVRDLMCPEDAAIMESFAKSSVPLMRRGSGQCANIPRRHFKKAPKHRKKSLAKGCAFSGCCPRLRRQAPLYSLYKTCGIRKKSAARKVMDIMDIALLIKTVGVGIIVAVAGQVLQKTGRDEQAMLVTVAGIVVVLMMLIGQLGELFETVRSVFGL